MYEQTHPAMSRRRAMLASARVARERVEAERATAAMAIVARASERARDREEAYWEAQTCEHGLSLRLCADPIGHYPRDM